MFDQRLRELRLARGLTLDDLAERMQGLVTKQALSKYERGKSFPRPRVLLALARALNVKGMELIAEPVYQISCLRYRTRAPLPPRTEERVQATLKVSLERRLKLEDRISPRRELRLAVDQRVASFDDVEAQAARVRRDWDLGLEAICSLSEVMESNGVHIFEFPGEVDFDALAAIARDEDGALRAIGIAENPDADGDRQRFNLAHELGHVVLDPEDGLDPETAANRFAGAMLAPAQLVWEEVGEHRSDVSWDELLLLKKRWGMSAQAILHRLRDLDVISQAHYEWWWREIVAMGFKVREPVRLEREVSTWEQRRLARAEAEGLLSHEEAATYAPVRPASKAHDRLDRRALMKLPIDERRAILTAAADAVASEYNKMIDHEWLDADLGEWDDGDV
ncbi:MAG: helix-turn-helix domain-containing protein [Coriobacteriia bacterium]